MTDLDPNELIEFVARAVCESTKGLGDMEMCLIACDVLRRQGQGCNLLLREGLFAGPPPQAGLRFFALEVPGGFMNIHGLRSWEEMLQAELARDNKDGAAFKFQTPENFAKERANIVLHDELEVATHQGSLDVAQMIRATKWVASLVQERNLMSATAPAPTISGRGPRL